METCSKGCGCTQEDGSIGGCVVRRRRLYEDFGWVAGKHYRGREDEEVVVIGRVSGEPEPALRGAGEC